MRITPKSNNVAPGDGGTEMTQLGTEVSRRSARDAARFLEAHPASSNFVTTVTDGCGTASFLSLAAWLIKVPPHLPHG